MLLAYPLDKNASVYCSILMDCSHVATSNSTSAQQYYNGEDGTTSHASADLHPEALPSQALLADQLQAFALAPSWNSRQAPPLLERPLIYFRYHLGLQEWPLIPGETEVAMGETFWPTKTS